MKFWGSRLPGHEQLVDDSKSPLLESSKLWPSLGFPPRWNFSQLKAFKLGKYFHPVLRTSQPFSSAPERFREGAAKSGRIRPNCCGMKPPLK